MKVTFKFYKQFSNGIYIYPVIFVGLEKWLDYTLIKKAFVLAISFLKWDMVIKFWYSYKIISGSN